MRATRPGTGRSAGSCRRRKSRRRWTMMLACSGSCCRRCTANANWSMSWWMRIASQTNAQGSRCMSRTSPRAAGRTRNCRHRPGTPRCSCLQATRAAIESPCCHKARLSCAAAVARGAVAVTGAGAAEEEGAAVTEPHSRTDRSGGMRTRKHMRRTTTKSGSNTANRKCQCELLER